MTAFSAEDLGKHANSLRALARDLVADEALAEDAVQDACVTALTRPPSGSLGGWLRAVVTNRVGELRRSEQRRRRREQVAARSEASEDADTAGQLELQQDILAAVRSLEAPYRDAVWMRYYEHRTPSAIAAALGEPVKTVKTRLWRALQLLRHKLDHRYGDRRAWLSALLPLARMPGRVAGLGAASAAGALLMESKQLVAAALFTLVLVGGVVFLWSSPDSQPVAPVATASEQGSGVQVSSREAPTLRTEDAAVPPAPVQSVSPYGSLLVRVRWHDGEPASQIAVYCDVEGDPQLDRNELRLVADEKGVARARNVHAGTVKLSSERGGEMKVKVTAGTPCEVDFVLPRGVDVTGTVVDERQLPVPAAQVVLVSPRGGWLGGRDVALTDDAGAFSVRSVDPSWSFGARKPGYAPSALVDLDYVERPADATTVQVQLRLLARGSRVHGTVVDGDGTGIPDATVALGFGPGAGRNHETGRWCESWSQQVVTTGADGTFTCEGVDPRLQEIAAWADGCTRVQDFVQCTAGQTTRITLALVRGVTVKGTARNEAGEVMADVMVRSADPDEQGGALSALMSEGPRNRRPHTRTDADGRFVLRGIPPGDVLLVAVKPRHPFDYTYEAFCEASLAGRTGEELTWDPVLIAGKTIRVRVFDADGKPAFFDWITAVAEEPAGPASEVKASIGQRPPAVTYTFVGCADVPYTIVGLFSGETGQVCRTGVRPGGPEVEMRLPPIPPLGEPGEVTVRITDRWQRISEQSIVVSMHGSGYSLLRADGDRFVAKDVRPGRYYVSAIDDRGVILVGPPFDLQPGQHLDLGELATEPGASLRIVLRVPHGAELVKPGVWLGGRSGYWRTRWDGTQFLADNVTVGRHSLAVKTEGWHAPPRDVEVVAGQDNVVTIDLVPAVRRRLNVVMPLPGQWQRCVLTLRGGSGSLVAKSEFKAANAWQIPWQENLPLGLFTLEAQIDGQQRTWPVDLRDPATGSRPQRFSLR